MNPAKTILREGCRSGFGRRTHRLRSTVRELKDLLSVGLVGLGALIAIAASGCASSNPPPAAPPPAAIDPPEASAPSSPVGVGQDLKTSPLDQLWESRRSHATDFAIGVGDIIEISVPGMQDFQAQGSVSGIAGGAAAGSSNQQSLADDTVRVDGLGDINVPLLGHLHAAGLTEGQLRDELTHRLGKYMYDPQVELFVKSYSSREVAISGEVHSPGMYIVNGPTETIHDLIIRAGGTTDAAAPKIMLTPASTAGKTQLTAASAWMPHADAPGSGPVANDAASLQASAYDSPHSTYVIDLTNRQASERYLNIPVRPGDTVYVPRAGSVTVIGWVYTPKTIEITPGLDGSERRFGSRRHSVCRRSHQDQGHSPETRTGNEHPDGQPKRHQDRTRAGRSCSGQRRHRSSLFGRAYSRLCLLLRGARPRYLWAPWRLID